MKKKCQVLTAVQLVMNRTDNTVDHSDPNGAESHNKINTTDRCCFLADPSLAQTNCGKMILSRTLYDDPTKDRCHDQGTKDFLA